MPKMHVAHAVWNNILWMHMWMLQLLPIPIAIWLSKRFAVRVGLWDMLKGKV